MINSHQLSSTTINYHQLSSTLINYHQVAGVFSSWIRRCSGVVYFFGWETIQMEHRHSKWHLFLSIPCAHNDAWLVCIEKLTLFFLCFSSSLDTKQQKSRHQERRTGRGGGGSQCKYRRVRACGGVSRWSRSHVERGDGHVENAHRQVRQCGCQACVIKWCQ